MGHFLGKRAFSRPLTKPWAMVQAEVRGRKTLVIPATVMREGEERANIGVLKPPVQLAELPDDVAVVDADGDKLKPSPGRKFYVSTETIDPCHALVELSPRDFW